MPAACVRKCAPLLATRSPASMKFDRSTMLTADQAGAALASDWRTRDTPPRALLRRSSDVSRKRRHVGRAPAKMDTNRDRTPAAYNCTMVPPVGLEPTLREE